VWPSDKPWIFPQHKILTSNQLDTIYIEVKNLFIQQSEEEKSKIDTINNYKFIKLLGKGSQSKVYLAENIKSKQLKAIKSFRKNILIDNLEALKVEIDVL
jgi:serine/threonine protein kinase